MANPEEGSDDGKEQSIMSVIGANGLKEFIMLLEWMVNDFNSTIKEKHFSTFRANYQIPDNIPSVYPISQRNATMKG